MYLMLPQIQLYKHPDAVRPYTMKSIFYISNYWKAALKTFGSAAFSRVTMSAQRYMQNTQRKTGFLNILFKKNNENAEAVTHKVLPNDAIQEFLVPQIVLLFL